MSNTARIERALDAWLHLPQEVRGVTAPIESEGRPCGCSGPSGIRWVSRPSIRLGSLFVLLSDRIMAYGAREFPVPPAPSERVLAFPVEGRDMRQVQLAELLGATSAAS